jgi:hypothetical protein
MNERWTWIVRYLVVIVLAVILAATLGEMALFKTTKFGKTGLNAARLVQFLGFGGALLVFWLLAQRTAELLDEKDRGCPPEAEGWRLALPRRLTQVQNFHKDVGRWPRAPMSPPAKVSS